MTLHEALRDDGFLKTVEQWWYSLNTDRCQRANLRRAKSLIDVYSSPAYREGLAQEVARFGFDESDLERLALSAGVLAHAKELRRGHFAAVFAREGAGSAGMRDIRFRKLLAIGDDEYEELYRMLVRLVRLTGGVASLGGLVRHTVHWNDAARLEWVQNYYPNRPKN